MKPGRRVVLSSTALLALLVSPPAVGDTPPSPVLQAMRAELQRSMETLADEPDPPYFLSYEITELHSVRVVGSYGTIVSSQENRVRQLDIGLRVGDYQLDNTRQIRGGFRGLDMMDRYSYVVVPIEENADAIRAILWYHTDARYKRARERLTRVRTNVQVKVEQEDQSADFSREAEQHFVEPQAVLEADRSGWEAKIRRYTAPFAAHGDIYRGTAQIRGEVETRWYVNSEGSLLQLSQPRYHLFLTAMTKAEDGMELPRYESFFASTPAELPDDDTVLETVDAMIADLLALREAPVVDPFTGPAILSGRSSGVFFHEVFGHRIEGHRQKDESEGQTFKKKLDEQLLPASFSVYFDPTLDELGGVELAGHYRFDNEGVRARRVPVIEQGVLKRFLMSRSPVEGFDRSNGHGRRQPGFRPVARQSNLVVEVAEPVSAEGLKQLLLAEIERQDKPYGLRFEDIQGGFTITGRTIPNAFNVLPIKVFRVYPDGREELVRGVDLIGTPLTAFSKIVAGDDRIAVFNGICGAESGGVPVAAASPAILVSQIEVQKKAKSQDRPPILPAPMGDDGTVDASEPVGVDASVGREE